MQVCSRSSAETKPWQQRVAVPSEGEEHEAMLALLLP